MQQRNLLVEYLGQSVNANLELASLAELNVLLAKGLVLCLVQQDLGKDLVGEGAGHDEGGVAGGAAQVDETALGEEDDVVAVWHEEAVDLWLDRDDALGVGLEPGNVDLDVEVADVADDGIVLHDGEVGTGDDVAAAGGGDEDLADWCSLLHGENLEARDCGLESVDRINLGDQDTSTHGVQCLGAALADITETSDNSDLASNHDVGSTLDAVDERFSAAIQVVELGLCDGVVDVDGWAKETVLLVLQHAVEVVDTGGGLL